MPFLETAIKILLTLGTIFFLVFSYACLIWTNRKKTEPRNIFGASMVSLIYTFKIFLLAFFLLLIASFFFENLV